MDDSRRVRNTLISHVLPTIFERVFNNDPSVIPVLWNLFNFYKERHGYTDKVRELEFYIRRVAEEILSQSDLEYDSD